MYFVGEETETLRSKDPKPGTVTQPVFLLCCSVSQMGQIIYWSVSGGRVPELVITRKAVVNLGQRETHQAGYLESIWCGMLCIPCLKQLYKQEIMTKKTILFFKISGIELLFECSTVLKKMVMIQVAMVGLILKKVGH